MLTINNICVFVRERGDIGLVITHNQHQVVVWVIHLYLYIMFTLIKAGGGTIIEELAKTSYYRQLSADIKMKKK